MWTGDDLRFGGDTNRYNKVRVMSTPTSIGDCMICNKPIYNQETTADKFDGERYVKIHVRCSRKKQNVFASGGQYPGPPYKQGGH